MCEKKNCYFNQSKLVSVGPISSQASLANGNIMVINIGEKSTQPETRLSFSRRQSAANRINRHDFFAAVTLTLIWWPWYTNLT